MIKPQTGSPAGWEMLTNTVRANQDSAAFVLVLCIVHKNTPYDQSRALVYLVCEHISKPSAKGGKSALI